MNTTLCDLARILEEKQLLISAYNLDSCNIAVEGCSYDSRAVGPGQIFICKGANFKPAYLDGALKAGAVGYVCDAACEKLVDSAAKKAPHLVVSDIRKAMAITAREAFGHPDEDIAILGITGTKGKSTVANMVRTILDEVNPSPGCSIIGTIETYDGVESMPSHNTTPEAPKLMHHLKNAHDSGAVPVVMEVSSQGLKYDRVYGLNFEIGCFLNIARDHISPVEHPNFEDYFQSKLALFKQCKTAVVNLDSDHIDAILEAASAAEHVYTTSAKTSSADFWADQLDSCQGTISFTAHTPTWSQKCQLSMSGLFNVENALSALAICYLLGVPQQAIVEGLAKTSVPGRMDLIHTSRKDILGLVDFAHNKLSFEKLFSSISQEFLGWRIISVFGAPGDKAFERRKELVEVAERYADYLIFCEDDPAHESAQAICEELAANITLDKPYEIVLNRTQAAKRALELACSSDQPCLIAFLAKGNDSWVHRGDKFETEMTDHDRFVTAAQEVLGTN